MILSPKSISPEQLFGWSAAVVLGFIALTMLAMAGPTPVVIWFLLCLPTIWAGIMLLDSRCWEIRKLEWKEREWQWKREKRRWDRDRDREKAAGRESDNSRNAAQWKREAQYWKNRAVRAEAAAGLWKVGMELAGGSGRGSTDSLAALAKACGSRRSLIALLHPDRHRNSRAANRATAHVMEHLPK